MFSQSWFSLVVAALSCATTHAQNVTTTSPRVSLNTGTVVGVTNTSTGVDQFLGIPFAQPPLGPLRFAAPVPLPQNASRIIQATHFGPGCLQVPNSASQINATLAITSEDCLTINVFRPAGLNSTAKLPVMAWVYGGSFLRGLSSQYDPTILIGQSLRMQEPIVYVSFNYRLGGFGFLASQEIANAQKNGTATLNAGLYDIQAALLWVQQNIGAFGGDKTKVTAFGESAGAISLGSLLVADKGQAVKKLNLFRGAIMESGAPSGDGVPPVSLLETGYQTLATYVGCGPAIANGTSLACLRAVPVLTLYGAMANILAKSTDALPFNRAQDNYFHPILPSVAVRAGMVADVPIITGNNLDEGTYFAPTNVNNSGDITASLEGNLYDKNATPILAKTLLPQLLKLYPDNPAVGSPYNPVGVPKTDRFYGGDNQYKRISALFGDGIFQSGRRGLLNAYIKKDKNYPAYTYQFIANTPGAPPALGVYHSSELNFVYGLYAYQNATSPLGQTSLAMMSYWIAFGNTLHPNRPNLPNWPKYGTARNMIQFGPTSKGVTQIIKDTYRQEQMDFLLSVDWTKNTNV